MSDFEESLPQGFNRMISTKVVSMAASTKSVQSCSGPIYDTGLIYSRVIGLNASRIFDMQSLFKCELSPIPTFLFNDDGDIRPPKAKHELKLYRYWCFLEPLWIPVQLFWTGVHFVGASFGLLMEISMIILITP